jgi:hypothetical protein
MQEEIQHKTSSEFLNKKALHKNGRPLTLATRIKT